MFFLHKLLAKLGYQTNTYKIDIFKSEHPQYIVINTKLYDATGKMPDLLDYSKLNEYRISNITGQGIFFAKNKQKVYITVGKTEINLHIDLKRRGYRHGNTFSMSYRFVFDAEAGAAYRFRLDSEKNKLEIIYEHGDKHKIYTVS